MFSGCSRTYPYLVANEECHCEQYVFRDTKNKIDVEFTARYKVSERIHTRIEMTFFNRSTDTLDLRLAHVNGKSKNVRYQYNGRPLPLPYVRVEPGDSYLVVLEGSDTETVEEPWHKIAGEKVTVELSLLVLGSRTLPPIIVTFVPVNPKFSS